MNNTSSITTGQSQSFLFSFTRCAGPGARSTGRRCFLPAVCHGAHHRIASIAVPLRHAACIYIGASLIARVSRVRGLFMRCNPTDLHAWWSAPRAHLLRLVSDWPVSLLLFPVPVRSASEGTYYCLSVLLDAGHTTRRSFTEPMHKTPVGLCPTHMTHA